MNDTDVVVLDEQAGFLLRQAHLRASAIFLSELSEVGLTPAQFFAMARLHEMGDVSQNHLGRLVAMDPVTILKVLRRLIDRGLLRRRPDPKDKRRMIARLTPKGRKIVIRLMDNARRADDTILEPLAPKERTQFLALLKRLV
jgi:DNA-binding MarR family transcriptional regulator